jgi:hypothetical protein
MRIDIRDRNRGQLGILVQDACCELDRDLRDAGGHFRGLDRADVDIEVGIQSSLVSCKYMKKRSFKV